MMIGIMILTQEGNNSIKQTKDRKIILIKKTITSKHCKQQHANKWIPEGLKQM